MERLSRESFRTKVFERDHYKCIVCSSNAKDAHHIIERRLWNNGGYYLDNGVSLCEICHLKAEQTLISCETLRKLAGIKTILLPDDFYEESEYKHDKWGNIILSNDRRLRGPLYYDPSVQKILASVLDTFCTYVKYPRTYHLPWSEVITTDDKILPNVDHFQDKEVIVTVKMDGEQSNCYNNYYHARSIDSGPHVSRTWIKNLHARIAYNIPKGWRVCGENLYAKHTIHYQHLEEYFMVFSIWNDKNVCLSWEDTVEWCKLLELKHVPVLYEGIWREDLIKRLYRPIYNEDPMEGYVVRVADSFTYGAFKHSVAKYVNGQFISDMKNRHHWRSSPVIPNERQLKPVVDEATMGSSSIDRDYS